MIRPFGSRGGNQDTIKELEVLTATLMSAGAPGAATINRLTNFSFCPCKYIKYDIKNVIKMQRWLSFVIKQNNNLGSQETPRLCTKRSKGQMF